MSNKEKLLAWLKLNWLRLALSLLTSGAVLLWILEYCTSWTSALAIGGLGAAATASWWVGWRDEA